MRILLGAPISTTALRSATGLSLTGAPEGQVQSPAVPLAAALLRRGHEVGIITLDETIESVTSAEEGSLRVIYCPKRGARARGLDLFADEIAHLVGAIKEFCPDVVHAHWTYEYAEAAVQSGYPHLVTLHDLGWDSVWKFRDGYRLARLAMKYRVMPRIKNLSVVAPFLSRKTRYYGYFGKVTVIPNGVSVPEHVQARGRAEISSPKIVTIGDDNRNKNVRASVEAFRLIRQRIPTAELHLFGPGLEEGFVSGQSGVIQHGRVLYPQLMTFLEEEADLLIHPSLFETFGMIIAEAKGRGIPVIAGRNAGGAPWVCGDDAGCTLVDARSAPAIAQAAIEILEDIGRYIRLAEKARDDVRNRFELMAVTDNYLSCYRSILKQERN